MEFGSIPAITVRKVSGPTLVPTPCGNPIIRLGYISCPSFSTSSSSTENSGLPDNKEPPTSSNTPPAPQPSNLENAIRILSELLMSEGDVRTLKCVLVGEEAVGKTSLIVSYTTNGFADTYTPTAFDNYSVVVRVDKKPIRVQLCDTAGQHHLDHIRPLSFTDCDVFIIVYSVVNPLSFQKILERWVPEINKTNNHTPVVLVGTQMDKRWSAPAHQIVPTSKGKSLASQLKAVDFFECSALTQGNVKMMFDAAIVAGLDGRRVVPKKSRIRQGFQRFVSITRKVF